MVTSAHNKQHCLSHEKVDPKCSKHPSKSLSVGIPGEMLATAALGLHVDKLRTVGARAIAAQVGGIGRAAGAGGAGLWGEGTGVGCMRRSL